MFNRNSVMKTERSQKATIAMVGLVVCLVLGISSPVCALNIMYDESGFTTVQSNAFQVATGFWEGVFSDNVEVALDVGFADLGNPNIIASAGSEYRFFAYDDVRTALGTDRTSAADDTAWAHLQTGSSLEFLTSDDTGSIFLDNNATINNNYLALTKANAKSLGFTVDVNGDLVNGGADAAITFNSLFDFDFDQRDGIGSTLMDFIGVAIHEIGHALGFVSGVDIVDNYGAGDQYVDFSALDLYRYSNASYAGGLLDLAAGSEAYFSLDGGATNLGLFSTGEHFGDGQQASHWKDNLSLGIMDPTFAWGEPGVVSGLDLLAFDAIGWDVEPIPEPGTLFLLGLGLIGVIALQRRTVKK